MIAENPARLQAYKGAIADQIAGEMQKNGGLMTVMTKPAIKPLSVRQSAVTIAGYQVFHAAAILGRYSSYKILTILENFDMKKYGLAARRMPCKSWRKRKIRLR